MSKHKKKHKKAEAELILENEAPESPSEPVVVAAPADGNGRTKKRMERRRVVNEDLQLEIQTLRQTVTEMLNRYKLKLDAELVQLAEATNGNGPLEQAQHRLPIATAEAMLKQIRDLEIKPAKGRAKDFQRVQELVGNLIEQLPSEK
jgi:hypothetical protein